MYNDTPFVPEKDVKVINPEVEKLKNEITELKNRLEFSIEPSDLIYQAQIDTPPLSKDQLYGQACTSDTITLTSFRKQWLDHFDQNTKKYDVKANSVMSEFGKFAFKPVICAGSGPSLKKNVLELKQRDQIGLVSCLHNFAFFEDQGTPADYYVTLDSQEITIGETIQGGNKPEDYYWNLSKDRTLVAALVTNPTLLKKWQGKILFYNTIVNDQEYITKSDKLRFNLYFNIGGNALGACYYMARAVLGGSPIAFMGADFSFSPKKKFHSWDSPYDKQFSGLTPATDVFGNRVYTWGSYYNFAKWFEYIAMGGAGNNPCLFYNCTEGGILGAYPQGNIKQIIQMPLSHFINTFNQHKMMKKLYEENSSTLLY